MTPPAGPWSRPPGMLVGVSLKTYLGYEQTRRWCAEAAQLVGGCPSADPPRIEIFVLPTFPAIPMAISELAGSGVRVGAQTVSAHPGGAYTGEVSASTLAEIGCRYAAVGHAERRQLCGETDEIITMQVAAAIGHGLCPVICVGEPHQRSAAQAVSYCWDQITAALSAAAAAAFDGPVVVAYEPVWAIGADHPAPDDHIRIVCESISAQLRSQNFGALDARVIYGGAAGPGLLPRLAGSVSGLFLGRSAHEISGLAVVLAEARQCLT